MHVFVLRLIELTRETRKETTCTPKLDVTVPYRLWVDIIRATETNMNTRVTMFPDERIDVLGNITIRPQR
jgi:hypothetical protein